MKVLITAGATREPIDSVRYLSNFSTGETGAALATYFTERQAEIFYFHGEGSIAPTQANFIETFGSFQDLDSKLKTFLQEHSVDAVIHAAAVSDYSPAEMADHKIDSSQEITLRLKKNFKIVDQIKSYSHQTLSPCLVAFKLTDTLSSDLQKTSVATLFEHAGADYVVHNDMADIRKGQRRFAIHDRTRQLIVCNSRTELCKSLFELILSHTKGAQ